MQVRSLGQEDPLEEDIATHSSVLAWRIPRTEEPGRLQSMGLQESDTTWWLNDHQCLMGFQKNLIILLCCTLAAVNSNDKYLYFFYSSAKKEIQMSLTNALWKQMNHMSKNKASRNKWIRKSFQCYSVQNDKSKKWLCYSPFFIFGGQCSTHKNTSSVSQSEWAQFQLYEYIYIQDKGSHCSGEVIRLSSEDCLLSNHCRTNWCIFLEGLDTNSLIFIWAKDSKQ